MAGVAAGSAGTLSIQLVAEIARLQADLDKAKKLVGAASGEISRSARAANDNLAAIGKGAGAGVQAFARDITRLKSQLDPAWAALQRYKNELSLLGQAYRQGAISQEQYVTGLQQARNAWKGGADEIVRSSGAMRAGIQNVGFQFSDFFVQVGGGTSAIRAAAQQMPQLTQAISMMGAGSDGAKGKFASFANFMGGPWGAAITVGVSILGVLATKLLDTGEASDKAEGAIKSLTQEFDFAAISAKELNEINKLLSDSNAEVERTAIGAANAARQTAEANREQARTALLAARAEYERIAAFSSDPMFAEGAVAHTGYLKNKKATPYGPATLERIAELEKSLNGFGQASRKASFDVAVLTAGLDEQGRKAEALRTQINGLRESYQRTGNAQFLEDALRLQTQLNEVEKAGGRTRKERKQGLSDDEKALKRANEATVSFIQGLEDEIARIGLSEKAIRQLEIAKAREAAVTEAQRVKIDELNEARERAIEGEKLLERIKTSKDNAANLRKETEAIERQAKALGLQGWERERFLLILEREAELRPLLTKLTQAQMFSTEAEVQAIQREIEALNEKYRASIRAGNSEDAWRKATEAAKEYDNSLRDIISSLQQIGGFGGVLGGLLGILTGNTSAIRGPIGDLLNIGVKNSSGEIRKLGEVLKDAINDQSGTLAKAIEGMGVGLMAANAILGKQGTVGQLGSAIGGAIGSKVGEKFLTNGLEKVFKGLGDFAGPIGSILGGLAGGLIGKLFGGTKRGSAIISGGDVSGFYGNSGKMKDQAGEIAGGLLDTLQQIANQFGTTLDAQAMGAISIGVRDGKYAVDTLGRGYTKSSIAGVKSFGTDAEAAVQFALKTMLDRGAIAMREGSLKIIREATDLQAGLQQALQFEEIMNQLESGGGQLVSQVRAIRSQFNAYIEVMRRAGASVQDLTRVQEMQVQRIKALIAQAGESYRSTFYTDGQNAEFAKQQIKGVLEPLGYGWIDTVAEYMAEVEKAQKDTSEAGLAWLETLYSLSDEFGVLKAAAEAAAAAAEAAKAQKQAEAAAAAAERERQAQERERTIEAARDVLRQAFEREAGELQETIDKFDQLGKSLREFRDSLTDTVSSADNAARLLAKFKEIGRAAALGDAEAMGNLVGAGKDALAAAKAQAASFEDYQKIVALVRRTTDGAIGAADAGKTVAQQQLDQLKAQVSQLVDLNAGVVSVAKAIEDLLKLTGGSTSTGGSGTSGGGGNSAPRPQQSFDDWVAEQQARSEEFLARMRDRSSRRDDDDDDDKPTRKKVKELEQAVAGQTAALDRVARASERTAKILDRVTKGGDALQTEPVA